MQWWIRFIDQFNGVSMIPALEWGEVDSVISTDACKSGIGGYADVEMEYFHAELPKDVVELCSVHINELECFAVVVALKIWGTKLNRCKLLLHCDNQTTVDVINAGKAKNQFTQKCLREIVFLACKHSFQIRVDFRPGVSNRLADSLSRWHTDEKFKEKFFADLLELQDCTREAVKHVIVTPSMFKFTHDW